MWVPDRYEYATIWGETGQSLGKCSLRHEEKTMNFDVGEKYVENTVETSEKDVDGVQISNVSERVEIPVTLNGSQINVCFCVVENDRMK